MYQILHAFLLFFKYIYYARSQYNSSPLYVINRALLNEKSWNFIINHCNFPGRTTEIRSVLQTILFSYKIKGKGIVIWKNHYNGWNTIEDIRQKRKVRHSLKDIVVIVLFATLASADNWNLNDYKVDNGYRYQLQN